MRRAAIVLLALGVLAACGDDDASDASPVTEAGGAPTPTTFVDPNPDEPDPATEPQPTSQPAAEPGGPSEGIGLTETVTISVSDP